jgi:23S rRNA (adenine2503-C2)-methyltransferase
MQAMELARLLKRARLATHVNLIPWNPVEDGAFARPGKKRVLAFEKILRAEGIEVSRRITRGLDAAAACGQLRNMHQKTALKEFQALE